MRRPFSVGDPSELPLIGDRVAARWEGKDAHTGAEPTTADPGKNGPTDAKPQAAEREEKT